MSYFSNYCKSIFEKFRQGLKSNKNETPSNDKSTSELTLDTSDASTKNKLGWRSRI